MDYLFGILFPGMMVLSIAGGLALKRVHYQDASGIKAVKTLSTHLVMNLMHAVPEKRATAASPVARTTPKSTERGVKNSEPVDLTKTPPVQNNHGENPPEAPGQSAAATGNGKPVRSVYGLRRVYSTGLGSGGGAAEAVIGKIGNTMEKTFDTITPTKEEIKGTVVSTVTVTKAPGIKHFVKPDYTQEMIDNRIEGVVRIKVLVDIDGKVKKAVVLNDLGANTAAVAMHTVLDMEFYPALRGNEPVAVWIIVPIRFVMLG